MTGQRIADSAWHRDLDLGRAGGGGASWTVRATKHVSYEVRVCEGVLDPHRTDLADVGGSGRARRRFIAIDENVYRIYGSSLRRYFAEHGIGIHVEVVSADESRKSLETVARIARSIDAFGIARRHEPIIAVGGGVLLDVACLTADLYRRGTPVVRVPTTLIGLVDAGVGVKTGINFNDHKNRLGTYTLAELTLLDPYFLRTLDRRHLANGLAEILKMSLVKDVRLFALLEQHGRALLDQKFQTASLEAEPNIGSEVMRSAIQSMLEELQPNLWETELERLPDYGHTFSPAIEMRALPGLLHGEAVNIDMALCTFMAWRRGMLSPHERDRVLRTMSEVELPVWHQVLTPNLLSHALAEAVRHRDGGQRLPLPAGIGDARFVNDVTDQEIATAVKDLAEYATASRRGAGASQR